MSPNEGPLTGISHSGQFSPDTETLETKSCSLNTFRNADLCETRSNYPIDNCTFYDESQDKCAYCSENYYLNSSQTKCEQFPNRVKNCIIYNQERECLRCKEDMYLYNHECRPLLVKIFLITNSQNYKKIEHCKFYQNLEVCAECGSDYDLEYGKCVEKDPQCQVKDPELGCLKCLNNYTLSYDSSTYKFKCAPNVNQINQLIKRILRSQIV